jgi:hypothetical protein
LTDEEYEKEKAEIAVHLELLMELLRENMKDQRHGWTDEEESEVAEATTEKRSTDKHAVNRRAEEARADDGCTVET